MNDLLTTADFELKGVREGKDFTPAKHPKFTFIGGRLRVTVPVSAIEGITRILETYGAVRIDRQSEQVKALEGEVSGLQSENEELKARIAAFEKAQKETADKANKANKADKVNKTVKEDSPENPEKTKGQDGNEDDEESLV